MRLLCMRDASQRTVKQMHVPRYRPVIQKLVLCTKGRKSPRWLIILCGRSMSCPCLDLPHLQLLPSIATAISSYRHQQPTPKLKPHPCCCGYLGTCSAAPSRHTGECGDSK